MLSASGDWQSMYVAFIYDDCRMLYSLLMEAKLKFANDDSDGSVICHESVSYTHLTLPTKRIV